MGCTLNASTHHVGSVAGTGSLRGIVPCGLVLFILLHKLCYILIERVSYFTKGRLRVTHGRKPSQKAALGVVFCSTRRGMKLPVRHGHVRMSAMNGRIQTTTELLHADYGRVELAEVKLSKGPDQIAGRIIDRWNNQDVRLRYRGHEHDVTNVPEWTLERYQPVTSVEAQMIQSKSRDARTEPIDEKFYTNFECEPSGDSWKATEPESDEDLFGRGDTPVEAVMNYCKLLQGDSQ